MINEKQEQRKPTRPNVVTEADLIDLEQRIEEVSKDSDEGLHPLDVYGDDYTSRPE